MADTTSYLDALSRSYTNPASPSSSGMSGGYGGGSVPNPTLQSLQARLDQPQSGVYSAIPGFQNLTNKASQNISSQLSGQLPTDVMQAINLGRAQQAVSTGMPGSSRIQGSLSGNATLRDIGKTSYEAQQAGLGNLLGMLGAYSGNVFPTAGQNLSAQVSREQLAQQAADSAANRALSASQFQQTSAQNQQQIDNQAKQFERNFGLQERQVAQQYGLSLGELALAMAQLQFSQDSYAQDYALKLAELQNNYNLASGGAGDNPYVDYPTNTLNSGSPATASSTPVGLTATPGTSNQPNPVDPNAPVGLPIATGTANQPNPVNPNTPTVPPPVNPNAPTYDQLAAMTPWQRTQLPPPVASENGITYRSANDWFTMQPETLSNWNNNPAPYNQLITVRPNDPNPPTGNYVTAGNGQRMYFDTSMLDKSSPTYRSDFDALQKKAKRDADQMAWLEDTRKQLAEAADYRARTQKPEWQIAEERAARQAAAGK